MNLLFSREVPIQDYMYQTEQGGIIIAENTDTSEVSCISLGLNAKMTLIFHMFFHPVHEIDNVKSDISPSELQSFEYALKAVQRKPIGADLSLEEGVDQPSRKKLNKFVKNLMPIIQISYFNKLKNSLSHFILHPKLQLN